MSRLVAIPSMSLDGQVADLHDGEAEVFDWYMNSGAVELHTGGSDLMTFKVSAPSAGHLESAVKQARAAADLCQDWHHLPTLGILWRSRCDPAASAGLASLRPSHIGASRCPPA
jgi:hypothetical protein